MGKQVSDGETICDLYRNDAVSNNLETESIEGPRSIIQEGTGTVVRVLVRARVRKQIESYNHFQGSTHLHTFLTPSSRDGKTWQKSPGKSLRYN